MVMADRPPQQSENFHRDVSTPPAPRPKREDDA